MLTPSFYVDALDKLIQNVRATIQVYLDRKDIKKEQHWDVLMEAVNTVKTLVQQHLEAIKFASGPLLEQDDLAGTTKNLRRLVENDDFPMGYDLVRGTIRHCSRQPAFSEAARSLMLELLQKLRDFQLAAFMIDPETWKRGDLPSVVILHAFDQAVTLVPLLEKQPKSADDIKTVNLLGDWVSEQLASPPRIQQGAGTPQTLENADQLLALAKTWCRSWIQQVRAPVVLGGGVMSKVGALEAQRPAG